MKSSPNKDFYVFSNEDIQSLYLVFNLTKHHLAANDTSQDVIDHLYVLRNAVLALVKQELS